jgi:hypothetical protein
MIINCPVCGKTPDKTFGLAAQYIQYTFYDCDANHKFLIDESTFVLIHKGFRIHVLPNIGGVIIWKEKEYPSGRIKEMSSSSWDDILIWINKMTTFS